MKCSAFSLVTVGALVAASAFGQGVKISQLPAATNVSTNDQVVIVQSNVTKRAAAGLLPGSGGGSSDWNTLSNRPAWITGATWQTNPTSPVAALPIWATDTNPVVAADELGLGLYDSPQFSRVYVGGTNASVTSTGWSYEGTNSGGFSIGVVNNGVVDVGFGISTNQLLVFSNSILFRGSQSWGTNEAQIALTRTNLRIPWSGVTNTNAAGWRADLALGGWVTNTNLTASLISDFSNAVVAVAPATTNASALTTGTLNPALLPTNAVTRATNGVAQAAAWTLNPAPTNGVATIETNQFGVGWDDLGRFTVNTPVGSLQMYETGSPISTKTIYWGGTIIANRFSAVYFDSTVYASNIVGGAAGGAIADSVMRESMPSVLQNFMGGDGAAGAAGVPYILTNSSMQPLPGNYVPYGTVVTNGSGTLELVGRWWDLPTLKTNLGAPVSGAAPTNAFLRADGAGGSVFDSRAQIVRIRTNNSTPITNANTYTDDGVLQATLGAGIWRIEGMTQYSTAQGSVQIRIQASNNMTPPRAFTVATSSGGVSAGYNDATNIILVNDGGTGTRTFSFYGILNLTNTSTVKAQLASTAGTTNSNMVTMLSNSFLILTPIQ